MEQKIRELKLFYINLTIYGFVSFTCILLWLSMGCGPFWPIWVIFGLTIAGGLEALRLDQCAFLENFLPFLRPEWEEQQKDKYKKITAKEDITNDSKSE